MIAINVIQKVDGKRLQRAVEALVNGVYTVTVTNHDGEGIWGYLKNGSGIEYGVVLTEKGLFCSCPDRMYRHLVCKHMVVLALYVLRTPQAEKTQGGEWRKEAKELYGAAV